MNMMVVATEAVVFAAIFTAIVFLGAEKSTAPRAFTTIRRTFGRSISKRMKELTLHTDRKR